MIIKKKSTLYFFCVFHFSKNTALFKAALCDITDASHTDSPPRPVMTPEAGVRSASWEIVLVHIFSKF